MGSRWAYRQEYQGILLIRYPFPWAYNYGGSASKREEFLRIRYLKG